MDTGDDLFELISDLVMCHSPSGVEGEVDAFLRDYFASLGVSLAADASGNLIAKIPGQKAGAIAITAHKDEIGAIVTAVESGGRVRVRRLGGAYPWIYGEGIVDLIGDDVCVSGVLSFGSRHISHASPQFVHKDSAPLRWADAWIETKRSPAQLAEAGIRPGSRMVVGRHRKKPFRLHDHIASYALDNKASIAILLELAKRVKKPAVDVYLVATAKEEVGAIGAMYFTRRQELDALIALEICPIAPEYTVQEGTSPVLLAEDGHGLYDAALNNIIRGAADDQGVPLQMAVLSGFASDGSIAMKAGHVPRAACLAFPSQNTHGYEIAHLGAISNCTKVLESVCMRGIL